MVSDDIEPRGLAPDDTHQRLIDASTKLRLLKLLLPRLKARGHRVLLFSQVRSHRIRRCSKADLFQFVIALNIVEDFLIGENINYLRLVSAGYLSQNRDVGTQPIHS